MRALDSTAIPQAAVLAVRSRSAWRFPAERWSWSVRRDPEALLSEEAFEHEEFLPYWAELWSSARGPGPRRGAPLAARRAHTRAGLRPGAPEHRRGAAGGRVLATDWSADAVARRGGQRPRATTRRSRRWSAIGRRPRVLARAPFQLVLGVRRALRARNVDQLLDLLPRLVDERGLVLLADPGRVPSENFLARAPEAGWIVHSTASPRAKRVSIHRLRRG